MTNKDGAEVDGLTVLPAGRRDVTCDGGFVKSTTIHTPNEASLHNPFGWSSGSRFALMVYSAEVLRSQNPKEGRREFKTDFPKTNKGRLYYKRK